MSKKSDIIAVITARGGSKGLPGKNIADLGGKPLLAYTVAAAIESRHIDRVVLSTDAEDIAAVGRKYGAEVPFLRPAELATDTAHSPDVVEHAVDYIERQDGVSCRYAIMLQPTTPFRNAGHIDAAIEAFLASKLESLITIKHHEYPPWWTFKVEGDRLAPAVPWKEGVNVFNLERQEFPKVYRPNGAFYITWRHLLKERHDLVNPASCGYHIMSAEDSVDIDYPLDLKLAEEVLKIKRARGEYR